MEYCVVKIIFGGEKYAVWCFGEREELLTQGGRVALFSDTDSALSFGAKRGLSVDGRVRHTYDMDALERMCAEGELLMPDHQILKFWELFRDISLSVSAPFASSGRSFILNDIYDKLCMTVYADLDSESLLLDDNEYELIAGVLSEGVRMFRQNSVTADLG